MIDATLSNFDVEMGGGLGQAALEMNVTVESKTYSLLKPWILDF